MSNDRLKYLLEKYAADVSTPAETKEFFGWLKKSNDDGLLKDKIKELWSERKSDKQLPEVDWNIIYTKIINTPGIARRHIWSHIAAAAVIILLFSGAFYFIFNDHSVKQIARTEATGQIKNDMAPGGNKAILTLGNGRQIILDSAANGPLTQQGDIKIIKLDSGRLAYNSLNGKAGKVLYNTISTPRGGQYQVVLADGSKVWLNAESSITFPTAFTGHERRVQLTGEAYFEVAKNKNMPFKVKAGTSEIEVLGTHFNVNSYEDEAIAKTTLLEGRIKISTSALSGQSPKFLRPGQQAEINKDGNIYVTNNADTEESVAWMHGYFQFRSADLKTILRQISRWYDVEIEYKGNVDLHFTGQLTRNQNVSKVLEKLTLTKEVHFEIEGRKIIVSP